MPRSIKCKFTKQFLRDLNRLSFSQKRRLKRRLELFRVNLYDPILNSHALKGSMAGRFTINITGDIRAVYRVLYRKKDEMKVEFVRLGTHSQLY